MGIGFFLVFDTSPPTPLLEERGVRPSL